MSETRNTVWHYGLNQNCTRLLHPSKVIWGKERVAKEKLAGIELILHRAFRQLIFHDNFYVGLISRKKKTITKNIKNESKPLLSEDCLESEGKGSRRLSLVLPKGDLLHGDLCAAQVLPCQPKDDWYCSHPGGVKT